VALTASPITQRQQPVRLPDSPDSANSAGSTGDSETPDGRPQRDFVCSECLELHTKSDVGPAGTPPLKF